MKPIKAYKSSDGIIFETEREAIKHELDFQLQLEYKLEDDTGLDFFDFMEILEINLEFVEKAIQSIKH